MNELALFAGAGGGILGGQLLGWRTVCAVERNAYAASVLVARQNDRLLPAFPIWDDVCTFDGTAWHGIVDVVSGGFPCQDISAAGKGAGIDGERSGLWKEFARIVCEVRPRFVFVENSPMLTVRGLGRVLGDLAALGYDAEWGVLGANAVGAPHKRDRMWIVAYSECAKRGQECGTRNRLARQYCVSQRQEGASGAGGGCKNVADTYGSYKHGRGGTLQMGRKRCESAAAKNGDAARAEWNVEPCVGRVADGVAARVDRLTAIGNGQVPQCAAEAWLRLSARFGF